METLDTYYKVHSTVIFTRAKTNDIQIKRYQHRLNAIIDASKDLPATKRNAKKTINKLTYVHDSVVFPEFKKKWDVMIETEELYNNFIEELNNLINNIL